MTLTSALVCRLTGATSGSASSTSGGTGGSSGAESSGALSNVGIQSNTDGSPNKHLKNQQVRTNQPDECVPVGEEFMSHSIQIWRLIRARNIANAERARALEEATLAEIEKFQRQHQAYANLQMQLDKLPEMQRTLMQMHKNVEAIINKTSRLELALDIVLKERDKAKLAELEMERENELAVMRVTLEREYLATKRNVEAAREKRVQKEINARKEAYENQLRQALQTFTAQAISSPAGLTTPASGATAAPVTPVAGASQSNSNPPTLTILSTPTVTSIVSNVSKEATPPQTSAPTESTQQEDSADAATAEPSSLLDDSK